MRGMCVKVRALGTRSWCVCTCPVRAWVQRATAAALARARWREQLFLSCKGGTADREKEREAHRQRVFHQPANSAAAENIEKRVCVFLS